LGFFPPEHLRAETNPLHVSNFTINLYGKYSLTQVLAIGVDVLWGFTGLLSLGQCLFFALGGRVWHVSHAQDRKLGQ
jgi:urea transport system permease protein